MSASRGEIHDPDPNGNHTPEPSESFGPIPVVPDNEEQGTMSGEIFDRWRSYPDGVWIVLDRGGDPVAMLHRPDVDAFPPLVEARAENARLRVEVDELAQGDAVVFENAALRSENARLREALRQLLDRMTDRGSIGGVDSHLRTTWFSVAEVERLRASLAETGDES